MPEPLLCCYVPHASSDVLVVDGGVFTFFVRGVWFVVRSNLLVEIFSIYNVCVFLQLSACFFEAQSKLVVRGRLHKMK